MAGHSHWAGIKHKKGRADKERSKIFSKLSREITVAAKLGDKDPDMNPRLRTAIQAAKQANMPKDNISRAISKSEMSGDKNYESLRYEGFGPSNIALIIETLTDNKNRSASSIRTVLQKKGGRLGETGSTSTSFAAGNQIADGSADMSIAKLIEAKKILDLADVDPSIPRYIAVGPNQIEALLNTTSVTSSDFNTVKALVQGDVDTFLGFKFIVTNRLSIASNIRSCFAWAEDGIALGVGKDVSARIDERADKGYATQVYYCMSIGATRMEEDKVVQIDCDESA